MTLCKNELSQNELACLLSHVSLWQKAIDEKIPAIAIFEDDIHLSQDAELFLKDSNWLSHDIVKIEKVYSKVFLDLNKSNIDKELKSEEELLYGVKEKENEEEKNDISENILNKKNKEIKNKYDKLSEREKILISDLLKKDDEEKKTILTDIEKEEETEKEKENEIKKIIKI